jgi:hypothetical protein
MIQGVKIVFDWILKAIELARVIYEPLSFPILFL